MANDIAIVGMSGLFPQANTLDDFWQLICDRQYCAKEIPISRSILPMDKLYSNTIAADKINSKNACLLEHGDLDLTGFHINADQLDQLDMMFQILLHVGRDAWCSIVNDNIDLKRVGVIMGNIVLPTEQSSKFSDAYWLPLLTAHLSPSLSEYYQQQPAPHSWNRHVAGLPAMLLCRALGFGGVSYTLDAACASSLYALKYAADELNSKRADVMLAGGLSRPDCLYTQMGFSQLHAISKRGVCAPFDHQADGLVVGEGCGIVVLKRLADALQSGDHIYATIGGIGLSNDVEGNLMLPASSGQLGAMYSAYQQSGWQVDEVDYIECHGTGTPTGDKVEFDSLQKLWAKTDDDAQCVLGSVKSNIGHLLTAAGIAGVIKTLLAMQHGVLPPMANFEQAAADIDLSNSPFTILTATKDWLRQDEKPYKAAVSAFGFGGINAHLLLEEWRPARQQTVARAVNQTPHNEVAIVGMVGEFSHAKDMDALLAWTTNDQPFAEHQSYGIDNINVPIDRFRIPPNELKDMLPQQLLMLKLAVQLSDQQGLSTLSADELTQVGVFMGIGLDMNTTNFHARWMQAHYAPQWADKLGITLSAEQLEQWIEYLKQAVSSPLNADKTMGSLGGIVASRIARVLRVSGPSFTVSSEECSGLHALHIATYAIQQKELNYALVGAVDFATEIRSGKAFLASCENEFEVMGDGALVLLLKSHADAVRDGNDIYAVIKGIANSQASEVQTVPIASIDEACHQAKIAVKDIDLCIDNYDKLALPTDAQLRLSHINHTLGYCGAASGLAAVMQAALLLKHHLLPQTKNTPAGPWLVDEHKRHALVNATAVGDGCVSVILAEDTSTKSTEQQASTLASKPSEDSLLAVQKCPFPVATTITLPEHVKQPESLAASEPLVAAAIAQQAQDRVQQDVMVDKHNTHQTFLQMQQDISNTLTGLVKMLGDEAQGRVERIEAKQTDSTISTASMIKPMFDRDQCMEFAVGDIAKVLGEPYVEIDSFKTRVRLPDQPLMLVDRILSVHGKPLSLAAGDIITEHDILPDTWYLDNGHIPICIAVESGQADLFLSAYLGIDYKSKGLAVYRLLDAEVCFHAALPKPPQTIRYHIKIERFFQQSNTWLFYFNFEATVEDQLLLTMTNGCAGFFTAEALAAGQGIVLSRLDQNPQVTQTTASFLVPVEELSYDDVAIDALRQGDLVACFGHLFAGLSLHKPITLPSGIDSSGNMRLVHRVLSLSPQGGMYGLGQIVGEADIHPDDWFLTCHFIDDQVMPGTLMYECCLHTLRIFLLRIGWVGEEGEYVYEPMIGQASQLKCRGQVTAITQKVQYEINIKALGYLPVTHTPYVLADALMYADSKPIVHMKNMSLQLSGLTEDTLQKRWQLAQSNLPSSSTILFDHDSILSFAVGKPSDAFGQRYQVFDQDRTIARLPAPPYQFLHRITSIENCQAWQLQAGGVITAEYDVPSDAWYFHEDRQNTMPFAILFEVALQPCGWLAAYLGSALTSQEDLSFRNLGGQAVQHQLVNKHSGTLRIKVKITKVSKYGGIIIQNFDFDIYAQDQLVYSGDTYFGFFSKAALSNQVGITDLKAHAISSDTIIDYPSEPPFPSDMMRMIDQISVYLPMGGAQKLGYIEGITKVRAAAWFFKAHFFQDPVWPGSLGLESLLQLMKFFAIRRWGDELNIENFQIMALGQEHQWMYRGQILPTDDQVTVQAVITDIDDEHKSIQADGLLIVDGRLIYQMSNFKIGIDV